LRVLLVPQKSNYPSPEPCLDIVGQGMPYLAASLEAGGHDVFGANISYRWLRNAAKDLKEMIHRAVADHQPDLIGVGGLSADYRFVRDTLRFCREVAPGVPVVCGGGLMTYDAEFVFSDLRPDFGVIGDAEETLCALADALVAGSSVESIPNLLHWKDGFVAQTPVAFPRTDLAGHPFPNYEPFDVDKYLASCNQADNWLYGHARRRPRAMPVSMARSCPYRCTFCCHMAGPKYRARPVANVIEEIADLYDKYRFNLLFVYDELFSVDTEKVLEFCARVRDLKMDFDWTCSLRVEDAEPGLLAEMKRAGCIFIGYGLESASQPVLDSMRKGATVDQIERAVRWTADAGIGVQGNFIFGDPAETPETIAETMEFYGRHCRDHMVRFGYVTPYPGSQVFRHCLDEHIIEGRAVYYDRIGGIGKKAINMTTMPDEQFHSLVDPIIQDPRGNCALVEVGSCIPKGEAACDAGAPDWRRRMSCELSLHCPYCRTAVVYAYPLPQNVDASSIEAPGVCAACHRRFMMRISASDFGPARGAESSSAGGASEVVPAATYLTPSLVDSYRGFNLVRFRSRIYALAQGLGPIDLPVAEDSDIRAHEEKGQCIVARTIEEAKRGVDNIA